MQLSLIHCGRDSTTLHRMSLEFETYYWVISLFHLKMASFAALGSLHPCLAGYCSAQASGQVRQETSQSAPQAHCQGCLYIKRYVHKREQGLLRVVEYGLSKEFNL